LPVRSVRLKLPVIGDPERHPVRPLPFVPVAEPAPALPLLLLVELLPTPVLLDPEFVVLELLPTPVPVEPVESLAPAPAPVCELGVAAAPALPAPV
jgi:hypothetical protein